MMILIIKLLDNTGIYFLWKDKKEKILKKKE